MCKRYHHNWHHRAQRGGRAAEARFLIHLVQVDVSTSTRETVKDPKLPMKLRETRDDRKIINYHKVRIIEKILREKFRLSEEKRKISKKASLLSNVVVDVER